MEGRRIPRRSQRADPFMTIHVISYPTQIRLGLRENAGQFGLLVLVNAFVGAMVGMERWILPLIAEDEFNLVARTSILSFILVFGLTKALTNYAAGRVYHLWRDLGYVVGALVAGIAADALGFNGAIWIVAALTFISGVLIAFRMTETLPRLARTSR
jgi:hypothetical protein